MQAHTPLPLCLAPLYLSISRVNSENGDTVRDYMFLWETVLLVFEHHNFYFLYVSHGCAEISDFFLKQVTFMMKN